MDKNVFILIPLFNAEKYISETINSVINQTYFNWELLVIDDCSTDNSLEIVRKYEEIDKRIKVIRNERNLGTHGNWNKGLNYCSHEYFIKLDADDIWHPTFLERSVNVIEEHPKVGIVFTRVINIDEESRILNETELPLPEFAKNKSFSCVPLVKLGPDKMFKYPILRQGISIMRSKIFTELGGLKNLKSHDTEFYYRVGLHYDIYCIDEVLYYYRVHQNSDSALIDRYGIRQRLLLEVSNEIIDYYYHNNKLNDKEYCSFKRDLHFQEKINDIFLRSKRSGPFYILLLKVFLAMPNRFLSWSFKVIKSKISNVEK